MLWSALFTILLILAGLPYTTTLSGTFLVTMDPAPIIELFPILIPSKIIYIFLLEETVKI